MSSISNTVTSCVALARFAVVKNTAAAVARITRTIEAVVDRVRAGMSAANTATRTAWDFSLFGIKETNNFALPVLLGDKVNGKEVRATQLTTAQRIFKTAVVVILVAATLGLIMLNKNFARNAKLAMSGQEPTVLSDKAIENDRMERAQRMRSLKAVGLILSALPLITAAAVAIVNRVLAPTTPALPTPPQSLETFPFDDEFARCFYLNGSVFCK